METQKWITAVESAKAVEAELQNDVEDLSQRLELAEKSSQSAARNIAGYKSQLAQRELQITALNTRVAAAQKQVRIDLPALLCLLLL